MADWKIGDPMTPAMVEKAKKTRAETAKKRAITDVRTALREMMGMELTELEEMETPRVFEYMAKSLIGVAARPGRDQLRGIQEIMDRLYGKSKIALDAPRAIRTRAELRQTIDSTEKDAAEAVLRKMGLDGMANELATLDDADTPERDTGPHE